MKTLFRSEQGYALILTLIFMPIFVGVALMTIDLGRAYNAQQDHQAAADALALAGAAELNGRADSITRAKAAMTGISNTVSFLQVTSGSTRTQTYTGAQSATLRVDFLAALPVDAVSNAANDDVPLTGAFIDANSLADTSGALARYVVVRSFSNDFLTMFFDPVSRAQSTLPVGALAVATLSRSTCDLTPMFMCNPFIGNADPGKTVKQTLLDRFAAGDLHGRMIKLQTNPSNSPAAGNIGYLDVNGSKGTKDLAKALAGDPYQECIRLTDTVQTKPGAVSPAWDGFNVRFDIRAKAGSTPFGATSAYPPASNVRKGWTEGTCEVPNNSFNRTDFTNFPRFSDNAVTTAIPAMNSGDWNLMTQVDIVVPKNKNSSTTYTFPPYWKTLYGTDLTQSDLQAMSSHPSASNAKPSRYDVYRYEIANNLLGQKSVVGLEDAGPSCITTPNTGFIDRRTMLIAVVDCGSENVNGAKPVKVDAYAKVFLVNPVTGALDSGSDTLDIEIVDLSEQSNGQIESFLRDDVVLVR